MHFDARAAGRGGDGVAAFLGGAASSSRFDAIVRPFAMLPFSQTLTPEKGLIFRITHRDNVPWILENGVQVKFVHRTKWYFS